MPSAVVFCLRHGLSTVQQGSYRPRPRYSVRLPLRRCSPRPNPFGGSETRRQSRQGRTAWTVAGLSCLPHVRPIARYGCAYGDNFDTSPICSCLRPYQTTCMRAGNYHPCLPLLAESYHGLSSREHSITYDTDPEVPVVVDQITWPGPPPPPSMPIVSVLAYCGTSFRRGKLSRVLSLMSLCAGHAA